MVNFKLSLFNVWMDENSSDRMLFKTLEERESFFDSFSSRYFTEVRNISLNDNIEINCIYNDNIRTISEVLKCNYACILEDNDNVLTYRYYFIKNISQKSFNQYNVQLDLDDITTNYWKINSTQALITRALYHEYNPRESYYNFSEKSPYFIAEEKFNYTKLLKERLKIKLPRNKIKEINEWENENIKAWCYIFLDINQNYNMDKGSFEAYKYLGIYPLNEKESEFSGNYYRYKQPYGCLCYPIYKNSGNGGQIVVEDENNKKFYLTKNGLEWFRKYNKDSSFFYSMKISNLSPLANISPDKVSFYNVNGASYLKIKLNSNSSWEGQDYIYNLNSSNVITFKTNNSSSCILGGYDPNYSEDNNATLEVDDSNYLYKLINFNKNYQGQLLKNDVVELRLVAPNGQYYSYDIEKLFDGLVAPNQENGKIKLDFIYNEVLSADNNKVYMHSLNGVYKKGKNSFVGVWYSDDTSIVFSNDKLADYLANNKNFALSKAMQVGTSVGSAVGQAVTGNVNGSISSATGTITGLANDMLNLDNLKNAKDNLSNASNNVLSLMNVNNFNWYLEVWEVPEASKNIINDYYRKFGYKLNLIKPSLYYEYNHEIFDYIEADIDSIINNEKLSNKEKDRLKVLFKKGVRFWHKDFLNYTIPNPARSWNDIHKY